MKEHFFHTVTDPNGWHARPTGLFVKRAQQMPVEITVTCRQKTANGKKLLAVMGLGVQQGDSVEITVEGELAARYAAELQRFLQEH